MEVIESVHANSEVLPTAFKEMTSLGAVLGNEVEVVPGNVEGTRKLRSPNAYKSSFDIRKFKFRLDSRCLGQRRPSERRSHGASVDVREVAVDAEGVKEIVRITIPVA